MDTKDIKHTLTKTNLMMEHTALQKPIGCKQVKHFTIGKTKIIL